MTRTPLPFAGILFSLVAAVAAVEAGETPEPTPENPPAASRGFDVEGTLRNDQAAFRVRVSVNHEDRVYADGEKMKVTVKSERDGYLYLIYKQADGSTKCLFPNVHESDNRIEGKKAITIPTPKQEFKLTCGPPFGEELLLAVVSERPFAVERLGVKSLNASPATDVDLPMLARSLHRGMDVEGSLPTVKPGEWAEHSVGITTVRKRNAIKSPARRLGLFIGISVYKDPGIADLHLCHKDAQSMADVMKERCGLDDVDVLVNKEATRKNIVKAFGKLKRTSRPGDVIFIYWSGHGARCEDTGGDEQDGCDEVLVPYDGDPRRIEETMIVDDAFGRWIQELDGRKVVVIVDACYGGGQVAGKHIRLVDDMADVKDVGGTKGIEHVKNVKRKTFLKGLGLLGNRAGLPIWTGTGVENDFLTGEMAGVKDIGQEDAVALFSSDSNEPSAERLDGTFSVMTYSLRKRILESDSLTLKEAYDYVKGEVPAYVKEHFKHRQTPQLCPEKGAAEIRLR